MEDHNPSASSSGSRVYELELSLSPWMPKSFRIHGVNNQTPSVPCFCSLKITCEALRREKGKERAKLQKNTAIQNLNRAKGLEIWIIAKPCCRLFQQICDTKYKALQRSQLHNQAYLSSALTMKQFWHSLSIVRSCCDTVADSWATWAEPPGDVLPANTPLSFWNHDDGEGSSLLPLSTADAKPDEEEGACEKRCKGCWPYHIRCLG